MSARKVAERVKKIPFQTRITEWARDAFEGVLENLKGVKNTDDQPTTKTDVTLWWITWMARLSPEEQAHWAATYRDEYLEHIKRPSDEPKGKQGKGPGVKALPGPTFDSKRKLGGKAQSALEPGIPAGVA